MTLLEDLQINKGGLLRLKTQLYWYGGRGWDGEPGRICLILDAAAANDIRADFVSGAAEATAAAAEAAEAARTVQLLIDGAPRWIWVAEADVETIDEDR
jgi:hypothetical protein